MAAACGVTDPPDGFPVAWMVQGCSPVDGPAVDLYMAGTEPPDETQQTYPHIRISIDVGADELSGNSFSTRNDPTQIFRMQRCTGEGQCVAASEAAVEFNDNGGSTVEYSGIVYLTFPDGSSVQGSFQANLHAMLILCG
jgi:ferredoxin